MKFPANNLDLSLWLNTTKYVESIPVYLLYSLSLKRFEGEAG
jgi:hypothetical protein